MTEANKNGQKIIREDFHKGAKVSTHSQPHRLALYACTKCEHKYYSATCERKHRKCPVCQGGQTGGFIVNA